MSEIGSDKEDEDKHPTGAGTAQVDMSLSGIVESIFRYFSGVREEFLALPEVHEEVLDEIVDKRISMFRSLSRIDPETFNRVAPVAAENTRYLYSGVWGESWAKTLLTKPNIENLLMVIYIVAIPLIAAWVAFFGGHVQIGGTSTLLISLLCLAACGFLTWVLSRSLNFVSRKRWVGVQATLMAVGLIWLTVFAAKKGREISTLARSRERNIPPALESFYRKIHWATSIHDCLWIVACIMVFRILTLLSRFGIKCFILAHVDKSSNAVTYSAAIQDALLKIAYILDRNLIAKDKGEIPSVPNGVRLEVINSIASVANTVKGPWIRSLRTGYRPTDDRTAQEGLNIAQAVFEWQARAVFGGRHLETVRDDCTEAYIDALDGNWQNIAKGINVEHKSNVTIFKEAIRKVAAIGIIAPLAYVIIRFMPHSLSSYEPIVILAAIILTSVQIIALIDPGVIERIDSTVNIINSIRRSPK